MRTFKISIFFITLLAGCVGFSYHIQPELTVSKETLLEQLLAQVSVRDKVLSDKAELPAITGDIALLTNPTCGGSKRNWLACAIYHEARGESIAGQHFVALAVMNRVQDKRWPNTVEAVVRQGEKKRNGCQFSFMCDGKPELIDDVDAWTTALQVATATLAKYTEGAVVTCAHSYHADYVTSESALRWFGTLDQTTQEGTHIFYCGGKS